jgi:hypothetical protein
MFRTRFRQPAEPAQNFFERTEQKEGVLRYLCKPRYDSGRTHPVHPNAPAESRPESMYYFIHKRLDLPLKTANRAATVRSCEKIAWAIRLASSNGNVRW